MERTRIARKVHTLPSSLCSLAGARTLLFHWHFVTARLSPTRSGSMEPAFYRGDLFSLTNPLHGKCYTSDTRSGRTEFLLIIYRVLETHGVTLKKT